MTLTSKPLAVLIFVILFGGIITSDQLGWWHTEGRKQAAQFRQGQFAGQADPADIRGSYTFGDVEDNFGVSPALLAQAFAVQTSDPALYQVKELETQYAGSPLEIGTASVRLFVAFYLNLPYDLSSDIYLPGPAADLLLARSLSAEQRAYLAAHTLALDELLPGDAGALPATRAPAEPESETSIRGKTTFNDLLDLGLSVETIESILGLPMPADRSQKVKDFCSANGLSFEPIKEALQVAVDELN